MARIPISLNNYNLEFSQPRYNQGTGLIRFTSKIFNYDITIPIGHRNIEFFDCEFRGDVLIEESIPISVELDDADHNLNFLSKIYKNEITFSYCEFLAFLKAENIIFSKKFRVRACSLSDTNFRNTNFNDLADFWNTTFLKDTFFYKTDFNKTAVFSMATFNQNVLFTYSLFAEKTIFSRTNFKKGLDLSQTIISGDLKLFNLDIESDRYLSEFYGDNNDDYQAAIDHGFIERKDAAGNVIKIDFLEIPMVNKIHSFQVLKFNYENVGNFVDATIMRYNEKNSMRELNNAKLKINPKVNWLMKIWSYLIVKIRDLFTIDTSWNELTSNDGFILALNRWSNDYGTNFWKGVRFTFKIAFVLSFFTLVFTKAFWSHICYPCELDSNAFTKGVGFFFNFLNPARRISDLTNLRPYYGIAYIFDFLGRILVGYGIYQTVQAFRKFK